MSIYGYNVLNRRVELRPLFSKWGSAIGLQTFIGFKRRAPNVNLKDDKEAAARVSKTVNKMVSFLPDVRPAYRFLAQTENEFCVQGS
jgi:hypothetical protein